MMAQTPHDPVTPTYSAPISGCDSPLSEASVSPTTPSGVGGVDPQTLIKSEVTVIRQPQAMMLRQSPYDGNRQPQAMTTHQSERR